MKKLNKVIAAMMIMAITSAMPAMAANKKVSHFDRMEKKASHFDRHDRNARYDRHAYRPDVQSCTIRLTRHESHRDVVYKIEHLRGVINTKWNARTREVTVIYDAKMTTSRDIRHASVL